MNWFGNFRRRHPRRTVLMQACLYLRGLDAGAPVMSLNLGRHGALFSGSQPVSQGEPVLLALELSPGAFLECKGVVRWVRTMPNGRHHLGVRFLDLSDEERDMLDNLLLEKDKRLSLGRFEPELERLG